jgi:hypothetical protein
MHETYVCKCRITEILNFSGLVEYHSRIRSFNQSSAEGRIDITADIRTAVMEFLFKSSNALTSIDQYHIYELI